jgi:hypothetical protein
MGSIKPNMWSIKAWYAFSFEGFIVSFFLFSFLGGGGGGGEWRGRGFYTWYAISYAFLVLFSLLI